MQILSQKILLRKVIGISVFLGCTGSGLAVDKRATVVTTQAVLAADGAHPGSTLKAAVMAQVAPGYHINAHQPTLEYLIPSELKWEANPHVAVQGVDYPRGQELKFTFEDKKLSVYEGTVVLKAVLKIPQSTSPGAYTLKGKFAYQACNDSACFPPTSTPVELTVKVVRAGVRVKRLNENVFKSAKFE